MTTFDSKSPIKQTNLAPCGHVDDLGALADVMCARCAMNKYKAMFSNNKRKRIWWD